MCRVKPWKALICTAASLLLTSVPAKGQSPAPAAPAPSFEVASIRENANPNPRWRMSFTADGVSATDVTLLWVLHEAYGIGDDRLWSGAPAWAGQKRFDIEAKFDVARYPNPTREQHQAMVQQLLADRFKLVVHHESREFPLYALAVAKNGPKLTDAQPDELQRSGLDGKPVCVVTGSRMGSVGLKGCTMEDLASILSGWTRSDLGRKIVDQTGLTGRYTLHLEWSPDLRQSANAANPAGPSIFTALKEQLGLELKPIQGPLDTIVIDHVEMPTEN
jgi:uncharacterized protein (TIGR03435 family)